jgi:hypothetical protein
MMTEEEKAAFMAECENKFKNRYTEDDPEFKRLLGPSGRLPPPVIPDWPAERPRFQNNRPQLYQVRI